METNRKITKKDLNVAERLRSIYELKKKALGLNQTSLAEKIGIKQATVSHYLKGTIALRNADRLAAFAKALEVNPEDINPSFRENSNEQNNSPDTITAFLEDGTTREHTLKRVSNINSTLSYEIGEEDSHLYPTGTLLIGDKNIPLRPGRPAIIKTNNTYRVRTIKNFTTRAITVTGHGQEELLLLADIQAVVPVSIIQLKD